MMSLSDSDYHPADDHALVEPEASASDGAEDDLAPQDPACQSEFSINDEHHANWLVRAIMETRRYRDRVEAWAGGELHKAERRERHLMERYGQQLRGWLEQRLTEERGRRRSICLPAGVVGIRATSARVVITDPQALLTWAKAERPELVQLQTVVKGEDALQLLAWYEAEQIEGRMAATVSKSGLNAYVAQSGELPSGAAVQPSGDELFIR